jgi:hypothetical protein
MTAVEFEIWVAFFHNDPYYEPSATTHVAWQAVSKKLRRKILDIAWGHNFEDYTQAKP